MHCSGGSIVALELRTPQQLVDCKKSDDNNSVSETA